MDVVPFDEDYVRIRVYIRGVAVVAVAVVIGI